MHPNILCQKMVASMLQASLETRSAAKILNASLVYYLYTIAVCCQWIIELSIRWYCHLVSVKNIYGLCVLCIYLSFVSFRYEFIYLIYIYIYMSHYIQWNVDKFSVSAPLPCDLKCKYVNLIKHFSDIKWSKQYTDVLPFTTTYSH